MRLTTVRVPEWPVLGWLAVCPSVIGRGHGLRRGPRRDLATSGSARRCGTGPSSTVASTRPTSCSAVACGSGTIGWCSFRRAARSTGCTPCGPTTPCTSRTRSRVCCPSWADRSISPSRDYREIFDSLAEGIGHYQRHVPTTAGSVRLTYFDNLVWDGAEVREDEKPFGPRDIGTYAKYRAFLDESTLALTDERPSSGAPPPLRSHLHALERLRLVHGHRARPPGRVHRGHRVRSRQGGRRRQRRAGSPRRSACASTRSTARARRRPTCCSSPRAPATAATRSSRRPRST